MHGLPKPGRRVRFPYSAPPKKKCRPHEPASFVLSEGGNYMVVISDSAISDSDIHSGSGDGKIDTGSKQLVFAIVLVILLIGVGGIVAYALIKLNK